MSTEETTFATTLHDGAFEVREYPALIAAEVTVTGDRNSAARAGFRQLAAYVLGANAGKRSIAMTAPVVQARATPEPIPTDPPVVQTESNGAWTIRLTMPRTSSLDSLPTPDNPGIELKKLAAARFAVVTFFGLARAPDVAKKLTELRLFAAVHHLRADGPASLARYNRSWTPWFMRRNEVLIPLPADGVH